MPKIIDEFKGEYFFLSNFYPAPHIINDILFPTTEHSFQALKDKDPDIWRDISLMVTPTQAKKAGGKNGIVRLRKDWEEIKDKVMWRVLKKKFEIPALRLKLLETGEAKLIEGNWWGDEYWGVCKGKGENKLGKLLMKMRTKLGEEA